MSPTLEIQGNIPEIVRNDGSVYEGNLTYYFQAVFDNARNLNNPYHNFRHMCHALWLCYQACLCYRMVLSKREMRNLLIAALFHDFNHTGKPGSDEINIAKAIAGLEKHLALEDKEYRDDIGYLITLSEYPYKIPSGEVSLLVQILRDADISQALSVAWIQQVVFGLSMEWGKSPLEVLEMQGEFHKNLKFYTEWAKQMFPPWVIKKKIAEAKDLVDLLTCEPAIVK